MSAPQSATGPPEPADVAELTTDLAPRSGYDVVVSLGSPRTRERAEALAEAGATWVIDGPTGPHATFEETCTRLRTGPP